MNAEEYELQIDAFSTSSIPMERLAEYMYEFARLLGNTASVHFRKIRKGSVNLVASVEHEAIPKVRARVQNARDPEAPDDVKQPYKKLNDLLRRDNAVGRLVRGTTNVIKFPGREGAKSTAMGPFTEQASFEGQIVRVGGKDTTAHALIEVDPSKPPVSAECTRELARQIAGYLYGQPVRVTGNARWERTELGEWELKSFRAKDFVPLSADDLTTVIGKLRDIDADWKREADPTALLKRLRGENGETH